MSDYSMTKDMVSNTLNGTNSVGIALIVLICINIGVEIVRFILQIIILNRENNNKRRLLIEQKSIKILEVLFQLLDGLTLFEKDENEKLLESLKEISLYLSKNKIYIAKKYIKCTNEILDYFKNVLTDYRQKSIEKETALFDKYCNEFNK